MAVSSAGELDGSCRELGRVQHEAGGEQNEDRDVGAGADLCRTRFPSGEMTTTATSTEKGYAAPSKR